jgi:hypothetical protein
MEAPHPFSGGIPEEEDSGRLARIDGAAEVIVHGIPEDDFGLVVQLPWSDVVAFRQIPAKGCLVPNLR